MLIAPRVDSYLQSVLRGDRRLALEIVDAALAGGLAIDVIQEDIVRESQRRIGALWERKSGGLFLVVGKSVDGMDPRRQMLTKIGG